MNLFAKINSLENKTNTEKEIIDFINKYPIEFNQMSIGEISERCYVSKASIYRLCNRLGYSGLNELKMMITASVSDKLVHENTKVDFNRPFEKEDSDFSVLTLIRELYEQTIYYSSTHLNMRELHYAIVELKKARNVILFVDEENYNIAEIFKNRMRTLGVHIDLPDSEYLKLSVAQTSSKEDAIIYATYSPKLNKHQEYFKTLIGNSSKIILISPPTNESFALRATHRLTINTGESPGHKITNFSNNLAFSFIYDVIYSLYFKKDYDINFENLKTLYMKQKSME
ncbi:MurR/RpiR family transcriptional regulator [Alkalibacterium pelagium]|uniref:Transcriptional regulator, RpiR family n=1 Tax=Alkalibacterium pelagium TaxID=426702 RepID=A0A1H7PUL8_9LACT|nr:MurR/RpiR family transcriptional regulator [Alkalibacterium pelagium]GEN51712.1 RpiR family transcriptional regulator [Alkalibacterium pelagium]SEL39276.1 transcriptional regulator, RpiR family [Alkalibacterium pelagium]